MCGCVCVLICLCGCGCVCVHLRKKKMRRGKSLSLLCTKKREKKMVRTEINKIINTHAIVTVHICTVTVTIVQICTIMHKLMWVFFCSNCVKLITFFILYNYAQANVIALINNRVHSLPFFFLFFFFERERVSTYGVRS